MLINKIKEHIRKVDHQNGAILIVVFAVIGGVVAKTLGWLSSLVGLPKSVAASIQLGTAVAALVAIAVIAVIWKRSLKRKKQLDSL